MYLQHKKNPKLHILLPLCKEFNRNIIKDQPEVINVKKVSIEKDFIACGVMFTYESLCDLNFYNENYQMREGHELINRFKKKYKIEFLKIPLYRYRIHSTNRTKDKKVVEKFDSLLEDND